MKISLPKINIPKFWKNKTFLVVCFIIIAALFGFAAGTASSGYYYNQIRDFFSKIRIELPIISNQSQIIEKERVVEKEYVPQTSQEEAVIKVVKDVSPSVVSIIITKNLPVYEQYFVNPFGEGSPFNIEIPQIRQKGTQQQEVGGGSGFIISEDGMILTNKHVVSDQTAEYTVLTNEGKKYPAKVLALDPAQDIAIIKIDNAVAGSFRSVKFGDSSNLQIGQTIIAIGNALGEFRNTVSVGVISGLGRTITASGGDLVETLEDVIQTDAAINAGNSGGPLLNLKGEVIGINTATVQGAQNIGFALPINLAKKDIEQVKNQGKISYPFLGIYYTLITPELKEKYNLAVDYGAWVGRDKNGDPSKEVLLSGSPAESIGLQRDDIILEFNAEKITSDNSLAKIISKYNPGDKITLKVLRGKDEKFFQLTLGERKE